MPAAAPRATGTSTREMPSVMSPYSGAGPTQRNWLPHGHVTATCLSRISKANRVLASGSRTAASRRISASRSGTTISTWPCSTFGAPVGRWNWVCPAFAHMFSTLTIR